MKQISVAEVLRAIDTSALSAETTIAYKLSDETLGFVNNRI
jgi:hypothetical protein